MRALIGLHDAQPGTHDLPYALQLCPRSVLFDDGVIVADGPTAELLADTDLLHAHQLELPYGFDPAVLDADACDSSASA